MNQVVNRVFYIRVDSIQPHEIPAYIAGIKETLVDENVGIISAMKNEGRWEDFFIPIQSGETKIEFHLLDLETVQIAKQIEFVSQEELFKALQEKMSK